MNVTEDLSQFFTDEPIQRLDSSVLRRLNPRKYWTVKKIIDQMGSLSAKAQGLRKSLTTYEKIIDSDERQILYILWKKDVEYSGRNIIIGLLKIGYKNLYLTDEKNQTYQTTPLCILDFYIHDSLQRRGYGHTLFDYMLQCEKSSASEVAIDKPSDSLIQFMGKHYDLKDPIWQTINFVVYASFFEHIEPCNQDLHKKQQQNLSSKVQYVERNYPSRGRDNVGDIMRSATELPTRIYSAPDTPLGRKVARDLGHQMIW
ncbi:unnamed protein product [Dracunculus medinensis]|uniref:Alpha-tubulin N-acetyltransferase n=1 Tax=Dracunculus medinensis TaxID=318479 RepID=A0A0N4UNS2_DRAME|nr:unnamed protein product [Dracunculus medinensis]